MDMTIEQFDLHLREPFTIARGTQTVAENVLVRLSQDGETGLGEAAPTEHYGELRPSALGFLNAFQAVLPEGNLPLHEAHELMDHIAYLNPGAKAAVDIALHDLLAKRAGMPLYELLGLDPARTPRTSFTIGIAEPEEMARKAREAAAYPILKVKVGSPTDEANLDAIRRERPDAIIRVDANEAWTPKEAIQRIEDLSTYELEFVEQPVTARDLEGIGRVRDSVSLPIMVDESCIVPDDVPAVAPYVDGIVIKLMKCGGILPALKMIYLARAHHLKVMIGCMIESAVAITAAAQISPLIDYADLDGNLLAADDPFNGVTVEQGKLILPPHAGLGITRA